MKVKEIMTRDVGFCVPESSLREVARIMEARDCGCVPVIDAGKITGMITDRDICLSLADRNSRPSQITAGEAMSRAVYSCRETDEIEDALATMRDQQVRRLPVTDRKGQLRGVLSLNDVALHSAARANAHAVASRETMKTLQAIGAHRQARAVQRAHRSSPARAELLELR
jgi:CBS domain-containing protein